VNNEKAKDAKQGCEKVEKSRIRKPHKAKIYLKLIWKIREVARGKGALS